MAGGPAALAKEFCIPEPALRMWLAGRPIPPEIFLRAVDIIVEHDIESQKTAAASLHKREGGASAD